MYPTTAIEAMTMGASHGDFSAVCFGRKQIMEKALTPRSGYPVFQFNPNGPPEGTPLYILRWDGVPRAGFETVPVNAITTGRITGALSYILAWAKGEIHDEET
jgi:hypothetical protein